MNKDFVIIVQGGSEYVSQIKEKLKGFNVIFSTWVGDENNYLNTDVVIYNEKPTYTGPANLNLQKITTINGLKKAKEMGFKRALKLRSDLIPTNMSELFKSLDNEDLNFLCWHEHEVYPNCPGYLIDYLMSGDIDDLIKLWDIEDMNWCVVPEIHLTKQYIDKLLTKKISYFLTVLNANNDLYWIKNKIMLSSYQVNNRPDRYNKYTFNVNKDFLNKNYPNFNII